MANTPRRSVRVDDETWNAYQRVCTELGTDVSTHMREHIKHTIESNTDTKEAQPA